ncbi:hypothetical protein [Amycolatopsis vastitatis]|uniref:hypothetical protein n=1 Tax=Amycolatopsis vastitatis TaxID=1905142 RepID=UPI0011784157|nr:hypothetical protein [Amycolatopsis vastitatis]
MAMPASLSALTPVERALVEHVESGKLLDLAGDAPIDETAMRSWDESRSVRAQVLRHIIRGRLAGDADPHGLRLRGARIAGRVDLENITSTVALDLRYCLLSEGINARDAHLPAIILKGCRLSNSHEPALDAAGLSAAVFTCSETEITAHSNRGAIRLSSAHLDRLDCSGSKLHNDSGPAFDADSLHIEQEAFLRGGFEAIGSGNRAAVWLRAARIGGSLDCRHAMLRNDFGPALEARVIHIGHGMFLRREFEAIGAGENGTICLRGGHIDGTLDFEGAHLHNPSGPAIDADGLQVGDNVTIDGGFKAVGAGERGTLIFNGGNFGAQLICTDATVCNSSGVALSADRLQVEGNVSLQGELCLTGGGARVTAHLAGLRVGGFFLFSPKELTHRDPQRRLDVNGLVYSGLPKGIDTDSWLQILREGTSEYAAQPYQQLAAAHRAAGHDHEARRILIEQRRAQLHRHALTGRGERAWTRLTGLTLGYGYQPWRALLGLLGVLVVASALAAVLGKHGGLATVQTPGNTTTGRCTLVEYIGVGLDLGSPLISTGARTHCEYTNTTPGAILTVSGWILRLLAWAFATLFIAGFTGAVRKT